MTTTIALDQTVYKITTGDALGEVTSAATSAGAAAASAATATTQAGIATTQAAAATAQAGIATTQASTATSQASAAAASATSASASASASATTLMSVQNIAGSAPLLFVSTAAAIANGVKSTTGIVGGSGGTNGQFDVAFSGGGATVQATARFTVSGGALTSITIISPGYGYTSAPTLSFAASSGLAGASATAVIGANVPVGGYFYVPSTAASNAIDLYSVAAGPTAVLEKTLASNSAIAELVMSAGSTVLGQKFVEDSGPIAPPSCYQTVNFVSGNTYTIQAIAKAGERQVLDIFCNGGAVIAGTTFDLVQGLCSGVGASISSIGNGWWLCSVDSTATSSGGANVQFRIGTASYTGDGTSGLYMYSAAVYLSGTNLLSSPTDFNSASWTKARMTITPNVSIVSTTAGAKVATLNQAVLGSLTGAKIKEASGASVNPALYHSFDFVSGTAYTIYVTAKAGERKRLNLFCNNFASFDCTFDLSAGTAIGTGASITSLGNGWYRCSVAVTAASSGNNNFQIRVFLDAGGNPHAGDGVSGLYVNDAGIIAGGKNLLTSPGDFSSGAWSKQDISMSYNQIIYGGISTSSTVSTPLAGLEHAGLGTSLTVQGYYTSALVSLIGTNFTNLGFSGGSLGQASNGHYGSLAIYNAISSVSTTAKIVTLECCTNDFAAAAVPVGSRGDSTTATFYGAVRAAIVAIIARAPNAAIFVISDHGAGSNFPTNTAYATNSNGNMLKQYWQAMEETCADMGVWFIDVGRKAGIGYSNANSFTSDGLHYNAAGGARVGAYIAQEMLRAYDCGYII